MKYAIKFYQGCPILDQADEIIIKYNTKDRELINFVQKWKPNQRIILNITELEDINKNIDIINAAASVHNITILCSNTQDYQKLAQHCLSYFFIEPCNSFDKILEFISLGVSDIYITEELGFYITQISSACHAKNVKIRVFPNVVQSSSNADCLDKIKMFFIRPEDTTLYENYIDVFEFSGYLKRQPTLFEIYNDGQWRGDLSLIIDGLKEEITNQTIMPLFGQARLNCKKRCDFNKCNLCNEIKTMTQILNDKGIYFEKEKRLIDELKITQGDVSTISESIT